MSGRVVLDTNIVIALFAKEDGVEHHIHEADEVLVPSIVLGELYFGARKSSRSDENIARVQSFAGESVVLTVDPVTAEIYGRVKNALRLRGRPIPENDVWVAALAIQHDATLATRDSHFDAIAGLVIARW